MALQRPESERLTMSRHSVQSSPYIRYTVRALINGAPGIPVSDVVKFAFLAQGAVPQVSDWKVGSWETVAGPPISYVAKVQIGPLGLITLGIGTYIVWIQIVDAPETIIEPIGEVDIF